MSLDDVAITVSSSITSVQGWVSFIRYSYSCVYFDIHEEIYSGKRGRKILIPDEKIRNAERMVFEFRRILETKNGRIFGRKSRIQIATIILHFPPSSYRRSRIEIWKMEGLSGRLGGARVSRVEFRAWNASSARARATKGGERDSRQIEVGLVAPLRVTYKLSDGYLKRTSVHYSCGDNFAPLVNPAPLETDYAKRASLSPIRVFLYLSVSNDETTRWNIASNKVSLVTREFHSRSSFSFLFVIRHAIDASTPFNFHYSFLHRKNFTI